MQCNFAAEGEPQRTFTLVEDFKAPERTFSLTVQRFADFFTEAFTLVTLTEPALTDETVTVRAP